MARAQTAEMQPPVAPRTTQAPPGCSVPGCSEQVADRLLIRVCDRCWRRLPLRVRDTWMHLLNDEDDSRLKVYGAQALCRLAAELAPGLTREEWGAVDDLAIELTSFCSFHSLLSAEGYTPLIPCAPAEHGQDPERLAAFQRLADLYDRAQADLGDPRRAIRLGWGGL